MPRFSAALVERTTVSLTPIKLDDTDIIILKALVEDGRKPYRQIAKLASVSTPTVENRIKRMIDSGLIKKISVQFDAAKVNPRTAALITLKVHPSAVDSVSRTLSAHEEVRKLFITTGENNLRVRVVVDNTRQLQDFMDKAIGRLPEVSVVSTDIITRVVKDEPEIMVTPGMSIRLTCDYCGGEIKGEPHTLNVGSQERYLCCKTCHSAYKEKYGVRINALSR